MSTRVQIKLSNINSDSKNQLITLLDNLSIDDQEEVDDVLDLDEKNLYSVIFEMDRSLAVRLLAVEKYDKINPDFTVEIINRINSMYLFSYTRILQEFLSNIIYKTTIDPSLKLECGKVLAGHTDIGYDCIDFICKEYKTMPTPSRVDGIINLMNSEKYKENSLKYFTEFIIDQNVDGYYRYKCILGLENLKNHDYFLHPVLTTFVTDTKNITRLRILCCQYILKKSKDLSPLAIEILLSFAENTHLEYNLRADAVDILLRYEDPIVNEKARNVLLELARAGKVMRTIYDNAQNVHTEAIEQSAIEILESIDNCCGKERYTFDDVRNSVVEIIGKEDYDKAKRERIEMSLTRILLDRAVYGKFNISLMGIVSKIWGYIQTHEYKEQLIERLLEELNDSSDVCSSGYAFRMVNTLSGFTDLRIKISFQDQIIANLAGRLNAKIRSIQDDEYMCLILEEMVIPTEHYNLRKNFLKFFRESIPGIRQEMYEEFQHFMEDTDYDLYFRKAIFKYEGME